MTSSSHFDLVIVAELRESERDRSSRFFGRSEKDMFQSKALYDAAAKQLADIHKSRRYSSSAQKPDSQAIRDFTVFMDANSFAYSNDLALEWLEFQRAKWSQSKYLTFRWVLLSINEILCTGTLSTSCFSTVEPKYSLPRWADDLLSQYLREREREGRARSTFDMIRSSCSRFIVYLNDHFITSETGITPQVIKEFQAQDNHSTEASDGSSIRSSRWK